MLLSPSAPQLINATLLETIPDGTGHFPRERKSARSFEGGGFAIGLRVLLQDLPNRWRAAYIAPPTVVVPTLLRQYDLFGNSYCGFIGWRLRSIEIDYSGAQQHHHPYYQQISFKCRVIGDSVRKRTCGGFGRVQIGPADSAADSSCGIILRFTLPAIY